MSLRPAPDDLTVRILIILGLLCFQAASFAAGDVNKETADEGRSSAADSRPATKEASAPAAIATTSPVSGVRGTDVERREGQLTERDIPLTVELIYKQVNKDLQVINKIALLLKGFESEARNDNMVVLLNAVSEDVRAVDGILELAREQYLAMTEAFPQAANLPEEELRKLSMSHPREIAILRDRAAALYRRAKEFAQTLNRPTGMTIERIASEGQVEEP